MLIMTRINLIFSSLHAIEDSPDCVAELNSGKSTKKLSVSGRKNDVNLVNGVRSDEELVISDQEEVEKQSVMDGDKIKPLDQNNFVLTSTNDEVSSKPSEESIIESSKAVELEEKKKWKRYLKESDPDSYYSLPFASGDYLPVYKAALRSDLKKLYRIAERNVSFECYDSKTGETPLHAACRRGNVEVFKFICSRFRDMSSFAALDRTGRTPFSVAVSSGNSELVLMMLRHCSLFKCDLPDKYGRTPIMYAGLNGRYPIFNILKSIGKNYLHRENSGRTLLSLILPSNPIFKTLIGLISRSMKENREKTIRTIAADISIIYEHDDLGGKEQVDIILASFGISIEEFILTPQAHRYNPINAVLRSKDYVVYWKLRHLPGSGFDINSPNDFDKHSFFERCLQYSSFDVINYLLSNDICDFNLNSLITIFETDRKAVLDYLLENYPELISVNRPVALISKAGIYEANKCFKYLLKRFWHNRGIDIFCKASVQICRSRNAGSIINLFDHFAVGLSKCPRSYLNQIYLDIEGDYMVEEDFDENRKKVLNYLQTLLRSR
jgi:ankyrin repeat protein